MQKAINTKRLLSNQNLSNQDLPLNTSGIANNSKNFSRQDMTAEFELLALPTH